MKGSEVKEIKSREQKIYDWAQTIMQVKFIDLINKAFVGLPLPNDVTGVMVADAIDWFFENEEMGIILEHDCLPSDDFFEFAFQMLQKYSKDPQEQAMQGLQERIKELEQHNQQLAQARDAAQNQVNAQAEQLQNQAAQHQELQYRQQLMQEEMIKAEAQIELIKDLLLREPGL